MKSIKPIAVGILPIQGFALLSYASVVEPFRFANMLSGQNLYEISTIGRDTEDVACSGLASAKITSQMNNNMVLDYLFVIAGGRPEEFADTKILSWIARMARKGTRIGGVSGGPVILVKAGITAGHRITVHWEHAAALLESNPDILLERSLFTLDRNILTCGGGAASLDMTLALIEQDQGTELMRIVGDWCLHTDIRDASAAQRKTIPNNVGRSNAMVLKVMELMEENIVTPVSLEKLAELAQLSPRQLNRVFRRATGESVMLHYRNKRLDVASNLLRSSALSISQIAVATGFSTSSHFSKVYRERFGKKPSTLRV